MNLENYKNLFKRLLPRGPAWESADGMDKDKLIEGLSFEPARLEERSSDFLNELDPLKSSEMLDNYERALQLPDECLVGGKELNLEQRQRRVNQKLLSRGGQTKSFYLAIASQLGYDASITSLDQFGAFKAGFSKAGDKLTNGEGWTFLFRIVAKSKGEVEDQALECVIKRFKPAHSQVIFSFVE